MNRRKQPQSKLQYVGPAARRVALYGTAGAQLARDVAYLGSIINSELKTHHVQSANNYDFNGTVVDLSAIPQGDNSVSRDGNSVLPRYINIKLKLTKRMTGGTVDHVTGRVILFRSWIENSGGGTPTVPSATDVLRGVGDQFAPLEPLLDDNTGSKGDRARRIEILRSDFVTLDAVSHTGKDYYWNIELNGMNKKVKSHMKFQASATATAVSGGLYILFISSDTTATEMAYAFDSKLSFYDN